MEKIAIKDIKTYIYDLKKLKMAKTKIFDSIFQLINKRPDKIWGRGQDVRNIIIDYKQSITDDKNISKYLASNMIELVNITTDLIILESREKDSIFNQSYLLLKSAEFLAEKSDIDIMLSYYRKYIYYKLLVGKDLDWSSLPDPIKEDDMCLLYYFIYNFIKFEIGYDKLLSMLSPLLNTDSNIVLSIALCYHSYLKSFSNKRNKYIIDREIKYNLKKSRRLIEYCSDDFPMVRFVKYLDGLLINQNRLFHMCNKKIYLKYKNKLKDLLKDLYKHNRILEILITVHIFIFVSMNMSDIEFVKYLLDYILEITDNYNVKLCYNRTELWEAIKGIVFMNNNQDNGKMDMNLFKLISEDYYKYLTSLPVEIKHEYNSHNFLILGNIYKQLSSRPKIQFAIFKVISKFIKYSITNSN